MFYYIHEDEQAARAAAARDAAKIRTDWKVKVQSDSHQISFGLVAPCDQALLATAEAIYGFVVEAEGSFSRGEDRDYGNARSRSGYAWIAY